MEGLRPTWGSALRLGALLALTSAAAGLAACGDGADVADDVAASCRSIEQSLRRRARSFADDPDAFLTVVRVEAHGTSPEMRHVALCARVAGIPPDEREAVVREYQVAVDEAQGLRNADDMSREERVERWRALLTRMADAIARLHRR